MYIYFLSIPLMKLKIICLQVYSTTCLFLHLTTRVQRSRLLAMLKNVDPLGTILRGVQLNVIQRRSYSVAARLALWHIDGYHKLIK